MGILKGLGSIEREMNKSSNSGGGTKARWLTLKDGQSVKIRFVNEIDTDSPHYATDRGQAIVVSEHTNPKDYKRKALCTQDDEGRCFGCEMNRKEPKKGWYARNRFYVNVLVDDGTDEPYVAVWSMGVKRSATFNTIIEYVKDSGSISNLTWRLRRDGTGTDTTYTLIPMREDLDAFDWSGLEPFDLEKVVREIPYVEQESFYLGFEQQPTTSLSQDW